MSEQRKATDVLLDLETKIDLLMSMIRNQDLNIKILSNKLNELLKNNSNTVSNNFPNAVSEVKNGGFTIEAETKQIPILAEHNVPVDYSPTGFRRTSRPETYSGDNAVLKPKKPQKEAEIIVPKEAEKNVIKDDQSNPVNQQKQSTENAVPIIQRVVDRNGKSIFLADVEVFNIETSEKVQKTRTNGAGKWTASLMPGQYRVVLSKRDPVTKGKLENTQDLVVDGTIVPLELKMLTLK